MFTDDMFLKSSTTGVAQKFVLTSQIAADKIRTFIDSVPGIPKTLAIKHETRKSKAKTSLAHLVQLRDIKVDATGNQDVALVGFTLTHPEGRFTTEELRVLCEQLISTLLTPKASQGSSSTAVAVSIDPTLFADLVLGAS